MIFVDVLLVCLDYFIMSDVIKLQNSIKMLRFSTFVLAVGYLYMSSGRLATSLHIITFLFILMQFKNSLKFIICLASKIEIFLTG